MGCASSKVEDDGASDRNRAIDAQIEKERAELGKEIKMLLLGTGESGKSTVMKQMTLMHRGGFGEREREMYIEIIFSNTVQSMQVALDSVPLLSLSILPEHEAAQELVQSTDFDDHRGENPQQLAKAMIELRSDPAIRAVLDARSQFQLNDSAEYFFNEVERTMAAGYMPNDADIIRSRVRTTGIIETSFLIGKHRFRIFDVGGQRSERKKWINCFEDVNVLLFLCTISEFDQMLYEDDTQSRMAEALTVFDSITNSRWFAKSTIVLFLNKTDIFSEKLRKSSFRLAFPDFHGDEQNYDETTAFLKRRFKDLYRGESLYTHLTCAVNSQQLQFTMSAVQDTITRADFRQLIM